MKCYNCGNEGHAQRDCPEERVGGAYGGDKKCYVSTGSIYYRLLLRVPTLIRIHRLYRTVARSVTSPETAPPLARPRPKRFPHEGKC
jgi:hypothetical protein